MASNIIIIGMPGSGKTTLGKRLASHYGYHFVDSDLLIEQRSGLSLQTLVDRYGLNYLRALETETIQNLEPTRTVIATGGSVVYGASAMLHLTALGKIVYLKISIATLLRRVNNKDARGLVKLPNASLQTLYFERLPLYQRWAEITLNNDRPFSAWQFAQLKQQVEPYMTSKAGG